VAVVQEVPIFSWTGGYIGIQGGGLWANVKVDDDFGFGERISDNLNGGLFGGYAGYNWQSGAWVFGAEGDINWTGNNKTFGVVDRFGVNRDVDFGTDYLASLRARVGYAFGRTLIFATGGVAFTQVSADATIFDNVNLNASKSFTGWTIGAGGEYAFTDNWIGRLEYRYYDFGNNTIEGFDNIKTTTNTVTAGIAYKF
jgi:outer membrane immunogenic protein